MTERRRVARPDPRRLELDPAALRDIAAVLDGNEQAARAIAGLVPGPSPMPARAGAAGLRHHRIPEIPPDGILSWFQAAPPALGLTMRPARPGELTGDGGDFVVVVSGIGLAPGSTVTLSQITVDGQGPDRRIWVSELGIAWYDGAGGWCDFHRAYRATGITRDGEPIVSGPWQGTPCPR